MNDMRLTDSQLSAGLRAIAPAQAQAGLRAHILAEVETTAQQRRLPGPLGWLADADPNARRRAVLLAAAALLALGLAAAGVVGALLQQQKNPFDGVDITPPKDLALFARSAYEDMDQLPPLTLTAVQNGTTKRRIYVDGSGAVRIETFASPEATEPDGFTIYSGGNVVEQVTVGSEPRWHTQGGGISEDPRVFVYAAMCCSAKGPPVANVPGCEVATTPGEEYVGEPGRGWTYVGVETVAGRPAHHVACGGTDLWLDIETRLTLRHGSAAGTNEVTEVAFGQPPTALFATQPPAGVEPISDEEYAAFTCASNPICSATPAPAATLQPAPDGVEPPEDLDALVAAALAADDDLPAYEVMVERTFAGFPSIDRTVVRYDGSGRYRHESTNGDPSNLPSIWLVGRDYSYRNQRTTDGLAEFWVAQRPPSEEGRGSTYPLEMSDDCPTGWRFLGVDLILDRPADHIGCESDTGLNEFWIDRETHLVLRLLTGDPQSGTDVQEVVGLRFVDQPPELFELPDGADVRGTDTPRASAQPSTSP